MKSETFNKEKVDLEEMDWRNVKRTAKEQLRTAKMQIEISSMMLDRANFELKLIWNALPPSEQKKRTESDLKQNAFPKVNL